MIGAVTLPSAIGSVDSWLDASWQMGLELSVQLRVPLGSRLFFSYGPYGYLTVSTPFFPQQWVQAVAATAVVHLALLVLTALLLTHSRAGILVWGLTTIAALIGLPQFAGVGSEGLLVVIILAFLAVDVRGRRGRVWSAAGCGILLAVLILVKATALPLVAGVLLLTLPVLLLRRQRTEAAALAIALVAVFCLLWTLAGLGAGDVPRYLRAAIEAGTGYSGAMYVMGLTAGIVVGAAVVTATGLGAVAMLRRRDCSPAMWLALVTLALFPLFKDTFVRDGPVREAIFFGAAAYIAALSLAVVGAPLRGRTYSRVVSVAPLVAVVLVGLAWRATDLSPLEAMGARLASYGTYARALVDSSTRHRMQDSVRTNARTFYGALAASLGRVPAHATIDVLPWDTGLFYANSSIRWDPRPVLQSYQAYTAWLDQLDAGFLTGSSAPDYLVYSYMTIDDRYAGFDEPASLRALLAHYRPVRALSPSTMLLQRVDAAPSRSGWQTMPAVCAPFGHAIDVPQRPGQRTYARITLVRSVAGQLLNLLAKAPEARITLTTTGGLHDFRLVADLAADGLYVSRYLASTADLSAEFAGPNGLTPSISSLTIHGQDWAWSDRYCVTFATDG